MESVQLVTSTPWLVFALVLSGISLIMMFVPRTPACIVAYMALWAAWLSDYTPFSMATMIFWGAAVLIVIINRMLLPAFVRNSTRGLGYMAGGAIVGMAIGLIMYRPATIIGGAILGTFLGALAYARTSGSNDLDFPTSKFFNYLGAKGLPAVVAASMIGLILGGLIARSAFL